jgi:hypothetical protein
VGKGRRKGNGDHQLKIKAILYYRTLLFLIGSRR